MKGSFVLVCTLIFSFSIQAKTLELKKDTSSIFIDEKSNWTLGKELFGMPFIYFSPTQNGQRSNISFTNTGAEVELDVKALSSTQDKYQAGKKKWADQVGAKSVSFIPYEVKDNKHGHKVHSIGFVYEHEGKTYHEKSNYIECRGRIIFAKSLRLKENLAHEKDFSDLIRSLDCGGV